MIDLLTAFGLVFVAELGDKSMMLAMTLAARYRPWPVMAGVVTAAFIATGVATLVGNLLGAAFPERGLALGSGLLFLAFGAWMLIRRNHAVDAEPATARSHTPFAVYVATLAAFLVAELGDKTTLATAALATTQSALPTWIGAALGMSVTAGLAIAVGHALGARLSRTTSALIAAAAFGFFGVLLLVEGLRG